MNTQREIKFRVWDSILKEWRNSSQLVLRPDGKATDGSISIKEPVQQFTGLKDSKGNEIYEGDIISYLQHLFNTSPDNYPVKTKEVKWKNMQGCWNVYESQAGESDLEVIGNIFENSELLNQ